MKVVNAINIAARKCTMLSNVPGLIAKHDARKNGAWSKQRRRKIEQLRSENAALARELQGFKSLTVPGS